MTEQATPRIGVIGLGAIGRTHIKTWKALGISPVAFADAVPAALEATVSEHGGEGFSDGIELINSGKVDVVSICTPPLFHRELGIAAAEAGVAVLCEKPLARTLDDAQAIADAVERTGTLFTVGFCHRFEPNIEHLKGMIDRGELGDIMTFRNRFAGLKADAHETWFGNPKLAGGGVMADTNIHSIDIFRYLVGDAAEVHAFTHTRETEHGPKLDVDDTALLTLKTAEGQLGIIEGSWRTPPGEWTVTVYGTKGTAFVDYKGFAGVEFRKADGTVEQIEIEPASRFEREFAHFLDVWRGEAEQMITVQDGLAANRILDEAYSASPN